MMKSFITINNNYLLMISMMSLLMLILPLKINKLNHPLNLMINFIIFTFLVSFKFNYMYKTWLNFILILIIIGGMMIIFMYITSISNNHFFFYQFKSFIMIMIKMTFSLTMMIYFLKKINLNLFINPQELWNLYLYNMNKENNLTLSTMFNLNKTSTIFMMLYLYFTMICIMWICLKNKMMLRQLYTYE